MSCRNDFRAFHRVGTQELKDFVRKCGDSVINTKRSDVKEMSPVWKLRNISLLDCIAAIGIASYTEPMVEEIPPLKQPSRFGNKAYRIWNDRLCKVRDSVYIFL